MFKGVLASMALMMVGSVASAAIVYEPVQYQYRDPYGNGHAFYYGGSNPAVLESGAYYQQFHSMGMDPGRANFTRDEHGWRFMYDIVHHDQFDSNYDVTYTDLLPPGVNARPYRFTQGDARNEAYANVPLYFRKRDLLASAVRGPDGHLIVPAQAPLPGTIDIHPYHGPNTMPASTKSEPQPILIIPKRLLNKPLNSKPAPVASAQ
ncbi:MAG TPA: hypothetical protein VN541_04450 [Tepidisphaeraceae bacterium]|nr:hypothetical protein [Tepidisphaeraceae bacterium]